MIEIPAPYNLAYIHKETKAYIGKVLRLGSLDDFWKYELVFEKNWQIHKNVVYGI